MNATNNSQPRPPRGVNLEKMRPCDECGEMDYLQPYKAKKGKKVYHLCRLCIMEERIQKLEKWINEARYELSQYGKEEENEQ